MVANRSTLPARDWKCEVVSFGKEWNPQIAQIYQIRKRGLLSSPDLRNLCNLWIAFFLPNDTSTDVRLLLKINAKTVKLMSVVDVDSSFRTRG